MKRRMLRGLAFAPTPEQFRGKWKGIVKRHAEIMGEHSLGATEHPYRIVGLRGPGGNPYIGRWSTRDRTAYAKAILALGFVNIHWHRGSGDSDPAMPPAERYDVDRLVAEFVNTAKRGGIFVAHDRIPLRPLVASLEALAADPSFSIVPLHSLIEQKFECSVDRMRRTFDPPAAQPASEADDTGPTKTR
jgi:hypothetical protein